MSKTKNTPYHLLALLIFAIFTACPMPCSAENTGAGKGAEVRASLADKEEDLLKKQEQLRALESQLMNQGPKGVRERSVSGKAIITERAAEVSTEPSKPAVGSVMPKDPELIPPPAESHAELARMKARINTLEAKEKELTGELNRARSDLMLAETEVERLSALVTQRNEQVIARMQNGGKNPLVPKLQELPRTTTRRPSPQSFEPAPVAEKVEATGEMPIATVISKKAHLRTGPGKDNSPLLSVSEGTRLAIETRQGDWYRVITPTGARAWVSGDVIKFGDKASIAAVQMPQASGTSDTDRSQDPEARAFDLLKAGTEKSK